MLNIDPSAIQEMLAVYPLHMSWCVSDNPVFLTYPSPTFPFGNYKFVFSVCESISVL